MIDTHEAYRQRMSIRQQITQAYDAGFDACYRSMAVGRWVASLITFFLGVALGLAI